MDSISRRRFLTQAGTVVGFGHCIPSFLADSLSAVAAPSSGSAVASQPGKSDERVLVVIQLAGGNDGLNTLIPFRQDEYFRLRPRLAIPARQVIRATDDFGWHPEAPAFQTMIDEGDLCVINGVGYPNPDRSHFVSTRIWETASPDGRHDHGWIGRYVDSQCGGADPPEASTGIALTRETPLAMRGEGFLPITCPEPSSFGGRQTRRMRKLMPTTPMESDDSHHSAPDGHGTGIETPPTDSGASSGGNLDFLRRVALESIETSGMIRRAARQAVKGESFPAGRFGQSLRDIARMIASDLPTRIYYAKATGFDTHANQQNRHARLLRDTGSALHALMRALRATGQIDRTLVLVFSEFGRRTAENASGGTDHGKAGPVFVLGGKARAGILGRYPSLRRLDNGDLAYSIDFRQVYGTVLRQWFGAKNSHVIGQNWRDLPFLTR